MGKKKRKNGLTTHHRLPVSKGGTSYYQNISLVPEHKHRSFHTLFWNLDVEEIAKILNDVWIDPFYKLVVVRR